jgi:hypothetical protein
MKNNKSACSRPKQLISFSGSTELVTTANIPTPQNRRIYHSNDIHGYVHINKTNTPYFME